MSSSGEVTILDSAQRLRYQLSRTEPPAPAAPAPASLPPPAIKVSSAKRSATIAYSPEESAAARAQLNAATALHAPEGAAGPVAGAPAPVVAAAPEKVEAKPAFAPARPLSKPPPEKIDSSAPKGDPRRPIPAKRSATVAYSPEESAQLRRGLEPTRVTEAAAAKPGDTAAKAAVEPSGSAREQIEGPGAVHEPAQAKALEPPARGAPASQTAAASSAEAPKRSAPDPALAATEPPPAPAPSASAATRPARKQTIAYSPEESALARAQLNAAQAAKTASTTTSLSASGQDHLVQSEVPSMLVTLGHRDEETSKESPLTYRERSYYWSPPAERSEVERALRAELINLQKALQGRARGQYINLAVFDHAFGDKPERPPVATLQWKDWRGEPVFAWLDELASASWKAPQPGQPVASSYFPDPLAPVGSSYASVVSAPPTPVVPAAPTRPIATPMRAPTRRESTGEQDLRLTIAFEAVQDLYFLATPADGLDFAVKLLAELVPSEAISGCIYDINTDEFRFVALTGEGANDRRAEAVRSKEGLFGVAAHGGRDNLIVPDVMNEPRFDPAIDGRHGLVARNMAFFVLHKADQLFGMLQLINRDNGQAFRDADVAVASYVANQMTAFLREKRGLSHSRG